MTLQKYLWFHIASLTRHRVHNLAHNIVKYLKIGKSETSSLSLLLDDLPFLFLFSSRCFQVLFSESCPPSCCRWKSPACDPWCCLKVLVKKEKKALSYFFFDAVHFKFFFFPFVYCDSFVTEESWFVSVCFCQTSMKSTFTRLVATRFFSDRFAEIRRNDKCFKTDTSFLFEFKFV